MGRAKRRYVPKVRGCFECSQRRVHCDQTQPSCRKCLERDLPCSGQGVRYRFATEVFASKKTGESLSTSVEHGNHIIPHPNYALWTITATDCYFLQRFSDKIAPILVTLDDNHNGWRRLVLPIAVHDDLVRSALVCASAFCVAVEPGSVNSLYSAEMAYQAVIQGLRRRQDLRAQDLVEKQCVVLTLLIMVATVMVNGSDDFRTIFKLLEASVEVAQDDNQALLEGELGNFLETQMTRFRGHATPFLSRDEAISYMGRAVLTDSPPDVGWRDFMTARDSHPELSSTMSLMYRLKCQACEIYLARAQARVLAPEALMWMVEDFKETLEQIPQHCPGEHGLVWPCFIVALESSTLHHRRLFFEVLLQQKRTLGFTYLAKALDQLERTWAATDSGRGVPDWVYHLTEINVFVC